VEELLQVIRKAASSKAWSTGVSIARGQRVSLERERGAEVRLRVSAPQQPVPFVVELNTEDQAWGCDCSSREDPCAHVVAACIAYKESLKTEAPMATSSRPKLGLEYAWTRAPGSLSLARSIVPIGADAPPPEPLTVALEALVASRQSTVDFVVDEADHQIDRMVQRARGRALETRQIAEIFELLRAHPRVRLDGQPVAVENVPLSPKGSVSRDGTYSVEADPRLLEILMPGLGRTAEGVRPLGETGLAGARWEKLPIRERFPKERWAELIGERVPLMEARFPVTVDPSLPRLTRSARPRIELNMGLSRGSISVTPELVYGRPPEIRIEKGRPIYLRGSVPRRDQAAEHALLTRFRDALNLVPGRKVELSGSDAQSFMERLRRWNDESDDPAEAFDLGVRSGMLVPRFLGEGEAALVAFESPEGAGRADAQAVIDAWLGGHSEVPLLEGGFAPLPSGWLEKHGHRLLALITAQDERGKVPTALLPDLAKIADALDAPPPPGFTKLRPLIDGFSSLPPGPRPRDLTAELRKYQERGVDWLAFLRSAGLGAVLADDMGLGKTLQTICVLERGSLVVCPTSVVQNWVTELARFRPELKVCVYHGPRRALDPKAHVTITTYALLRLDQALLGGRTWSTVVLDEAQAIKNPDSQSARAAFEVRADFRISLSGTPLENRLEELWSQLHFTNPGLLGGRRDFDVHYAKPIAEGHPGRAEELRQRIRPFVLRRMKEEVAPELPPRTEMVLYAELSEAERLVYDTVRAATQADVLARLDAGGNVLGVLEALLRLRQAACHSALVPGQVATSSSKIEALIEALTQVLDEGHRALVFSQWTSFLDLLEGDLGRAGIAFLRLDGSTTNRAEVIEEFQAGEGPRVFLISLKAGGTGLNLTAADHVFFLDPWWNPAVEQQAADRAHRIGQTRPVFVYRLVAKDTVEEKILLLQDKKRALAAVALSGGQAAGELTREDLRALLE